MGGGELGAEILWDEWGVPHIYADDLPALFRAFGWAQAHSHGDLLLRLLGRGRGRAAEYWGEAELESDRLTRTLGFPERARAWLAAQSPEFAGHLAEFAAGVNGYAAAHPERLDPAARAVLPVAPADLLGHALRFVFTFLTLSGQAAREGQPLLLVTQGIPFPPASNGWAIGPGYSRSGTPMLLANPHLPWDNLYVWYEAHLVAPGVDVYGACLVGSPVPTIAFNDRLGWTHTVNTFDGWDAYLLDPVEGGYRFDGAVRPFAVETQALRVRQPDGTLRDEELTIRRSIHGPVIGEVDGRPVALRVVAVDQAPIPGIYEQWWAMCRARDLAEFERALRMMQAPMFTVIYADADGHVLSLFNGQVPVRPGGDWDEWAGLIPGDTSATLWTAVHPYEDLPRVVDPSTGWVQNSNSPPWTTTLPSPLDPAGFPPYLAPAGSPRPREQRGLQMLIEHGPLGWADLLAAQGSTRSDLADRLVPDLVAAAEARGGVAAEAARVLTAWDHRFDAESRGAALFAGWLAEVLPLPTPVTTLFAVPPDPADPLGTPAGLAEPARAAEGLAVAAERLREAAGSLDVAWGDLYRLRLDPVDLPGNGARDPLGCFRATWYLPEPDGRFRAVGGTSYLALVEFGGSQRAMALNLPGNASQPGSPHRGDQLPLYASKELRPVWRDRAEIEAHLVSRERV
ncbi:MAG TPA: penicillin acylase family protein [Thermomicrobiaceae bacterium]|nr:penicillin acylase family protein [Thermomicrobiaceae bacterium]